MALHTRDAESMARAVAAGKPFTTNGSLTGQSKGARRGLYWRTGRLPRDWESVLNTDTVTVGVDYVVYSYGTPIAWLRSDGAWAIPPVKYSLTTTRHQTTAHDIVARHSEMVRS